MAKGKRVGRKSGKKADKKDDKNKKDDKGKKRNKSSSNSSDDSTIDDAELQLTVAIAGTFGLFLDFAFAMHIFVQKPKHCPAVLQRENY